ncbi:MAG: type I pullulanase [Halanaerobiales bacterium]
MKKVHQVSFNRFRLSKTAFNKNKMCKIGMVVLMVFIISLTTLSGEIADNAGTTDSIEVSADTGSDDSTERDCIDIPAGHVRLHYHRYDSDYKGWGLHLWGNGYDGPAVSWANAVAISGFDDYGAYWDIPYKEGVGDLNFIIHKGDLKDPDGDRVYPDPDQNKEIWAVSGDSTAYTDPEEAVAASNNRIVQATIVGKRELIVEFRNEIDKPIYIKAAAYSWVPMAKLDTSEAPLYRLTTRGDLDLSKKYKIECGEMTAYTILSPQLIDDIMSYSGELGANYSEEETVFKIWAPLADRVVLNLYKEADSEESDSEEPYLQIDMIPGDFPYNSNNDKSINDSLNTSNKSVWSVSVEGDLAGVFYQYTVIRGEEEKIVLDPYARSMAAFNSNGSDKVGKAAVVDLSQTNPDGWENDNYVKLEDQEDAVIYEMSVRDYTISSDSGVADQKKGTYLGFIEKIPHLVNLGVTHVQLMPVVNFYYGDEFDRSFENIGSAGEANYNWGYDPHNYFTPEGWFSLNPANPHTRVRELKTLVKALHDAGIGVVLDVVYNHTAKTSTFEDIVPGYYYRRTPEGAFSNGSGCGNDTASERTMMRKLMIDSATYWVDEYHIDGFRFDLMGLHDERTMAELAAAVRAINPDAVLHGEGWNMNTTLPVEDRYIKGDNESGQRSLLEYDDIAAVFSDTIRDGIIQPSAFAPADQGGFVQGVRGNETRIRTGVIGSMASFPAELPILTSPYDRFVDDPEEVINYVSCHDGRTLWDKINISAADASHEEKIRMHKLANAIVFTSQGKAFIHGGVEMLRSKPDPNRADGIDHNSYDSGDMTNQIIWLNREEYRGVYEYYRGLIELKKSHEAFRMETMEEIIQGLVFIPVDSENLVAFRLIEQDGNDDWKEIVVIYNSNRAARTVRVEGVDSNWKVVVDGENAGVEELINTEVEIDKGVVRVPAISAVVIHK